jgi:hypothetical protein
MKNVVVSMTFLLKTIDDSAGGLKPEPS